MEAQDVRDNSMVEFGDGGLGATMGEPKEIDGVMSAEVWPANNGAVYGPGRMWIPVADLRPADMDRWMYLVEGNRFVRKKPGMLVAEDQPTG